MRRRLSILVVAVAVLTAALAAVAAAQGTTTQASDDDGTETAITGEALVQASTVALEHLGEGRVTETEVGDEDSYYEVEVTLNDGSEVDVQLDEEFNVVGSEADTDSD